MEQAGTGELRVLGNNVSTTVASRYYGAIQQQETSSSHTSDTASEITAENKIKHKLFVDQEVQTRKKNNKTDRVTEERRRNFPDLDQS